MDGKDLNADIAAELKKKQPLTKRRVIFDVVQENFKTICFYREENYAFCQIHEAFQSAGLLNCSLSYFKACFYRVRQNRALLAKVRDSSSIANECDLPLQASIYSDEANEGLNRNLGASRQTDEMSEVSFDPNAAMESIFGPSIKTQEGEDVDQDCDESAIQSSPKSPSILTPMLAAQLEMSREKLAEHKRLMKKYKTGG